MIIKILGSGSSCGVPSASGWFGQCTDLDSRNYRTRSSIFIEDIEKNKNLLIDAGPDLRIQCLRNNIKRIDEVFITHTHADHCLGCDELRSFYFTHKQQIKMYCHTKFKERLLNIFPYCISTESISSVIYLQTFDSDKISINFYSDIICIKQIHGTDISYGIRIGNFAYCVDVLKFEEKEFTKLYGVKLLIIGCVDYNDHTAHAGYKTVMQWIDKLKPERTILTHLSPNIPYKYHTNVEIAYDTMIIDAHRFL